MPISKNQARRLFKFVAEMKKNNYPNASGFTELLHNAGLYGASEREVCIKTVRRDSLKTSYFMASILGAQIAKDIIPGHMRFSAKTKNLDAFNSRPADTTLSIDEDGEIIQKCLPFLVIIIDEFADIMMTDAKSDVETYVRRSAADPPRPQRAWSLGFPIPEF